MFFEGPHKEVARSYKVLDDIEVGFFGLTSLESNTALPSTWHTLETQSTLEKALVTVREIKDTKESEGIQSAPI